MRTRPFDGARVAAVAMLAGALIGACRPAGDSGGAAATGAGPRTGTVAASGEPSLFDLGFAMTDQDGRQRRLAELRGRPFVASMIYTRCTSVCPRVTADLKRLEGALDPGDRERTRFVLFSLDPERDTPAALTAFAAEHHLDTSRWTLLAATPDDMRTLAAVLDVRFRPEGDGEIAHSAAIAVVDRDGVVRHRQVGLAADAAPLVAAVQGVN